MYICFGFCFLIITNLVYMIIIFSKQQKLDPKNSFQNVVIKGISIQVFLLKTILQIPVAESFFGTIFCFKDSNINKSSNCYSDLNYTIHVGFATTGYLLNLIINTILIMFLEDQNFDSNYPLASNKSNYMNFKFIVKQVIVLYTVLDYKFSLYPVFVVFMILSSSTIITGLIKMQPFFFEGLNNFLLVIESILVWISFNIAI